MRQGRVSQVRNRVRTGRAVGMMRAMIKPVAVAVVASALALSAASAHAGSKSWAAVKGSINPKANVIAGGSLGPVRSTKLFSSAVQLLVSEEHDVQEAFTLIKDACSIDVPAAIADFTVIMKDGDDPLVVLGLDGVDEKRALTCLEAIGSKQTGKAVKVTGKKKGKVTTYSIAGEKDKLYFAWLAPDVLAFTEDPNKPGKLEKALAGKAAKGDLGKLVAKVNPDAPLWAAVAMKEKEDGMQINGGYGAVELAGGKFTGTVHVVMGSDADAQKAAAMGTAGLGELKQKAAKTSVAALINSVTIAATGLELTVTGAVADGDLMKLMADFDTVF